MSRIIINADDCGKTVIVNSAIKEAISRGLVTSTTVMANMDDFNGAVELYREYGQIVSFGWHINLTEGSPLTRSQVLLDNGFYKENNGAVYFNGEAFWRSYLSKEMCVDIKRELRTQFEKIKDSGIDITHADGHHHIYTAPSMLFLMPALFNELKITRCRNIRNYDVPVLSYITRRLWSIPLKFQGIKMPDLFTSFTTFYNKPNLRCGKTIELECHPGHPQEKYKKEMELLYSTDINKWNVKLITYKEI